MNTTEYLMRYFAAAGKLAADENLWDKVKAFVGVLRRVKRNEGRVFVIGLGGSAANASHAVNDFRKIADIETYAPTDNVAELTARINDQDFDTSLVEWLKGSRLRTNDVLLVLSTGGGSYKFGKPTSAPLLMAAQWARQQGAEVVSILGNPKGLLNLPSYSSLVIVTPAPSGFMVPLAESFQAVVWHAACNAVAQDED